MNSAARHRCMIYADPPEQQLPYLASLLTKELRAGARCVYVNSPEMIAALRACLITSGIDADSEIGKGTLIVSADRSHLTSGRFDSSAMLSSLAAVIADAQADGFLKLWVTGDMTWEFGDRKDFTELLAYERGLERLFQQHPILHGLCQYHQDALPTSALRDALCTHQSVYVNQTLFRLNPYFTPEFAPLKTPPIPTDIKDLIERFHQHQ